MTHCRGLCGTALAGLLSTLQSSVVNQVTGIVALEAQIETALCRRRPSPPRVPQGYLDSSMICRYNDDPSNACATTLLGGDGHLDLARRCWRPSPRHSWEPRFRIRWEDQAGTRRPA